VIPGGAEEAAVLLQDVMLLDLSAERCADFYAKCFGHAPQWVAAAPGRVNLIGEHTDYNEGFVLPMALERCTIMAGGRLPGQEAIVHSVTTGDSARLGLRPAVAKGDPAWSNYVRGVVAGFQKRGIKVPAFSAVIDSDVPFGGGLASSAALEVATATFLETMCGRNLDPVEKALLCQQAEHEFAGVPCGIMDQFTSVLAQKDHALLLDCRSRTTRPVPMSDPDITVLVINTNVRHKLADGEYAKRRAQCEAAAGVLGVPALRDANLPMLADAKPRLDPVVFRRAHHVITENQRTLDMADAIAAGQWEKAGALMYASHQSLRDDYEVSCPELDVVVDIAREIGEKEGVVGCRMTGGGFGGCAVGLVHTEAAKRLIRKFDEQYERKTRIQAAIFSTRPGPGARLIS
jgi:galactokinase